MIGEDVDLDGDPDIVTSLNAHGYGLAWFEQVIGASDRRFDPHVIVPVDEPSADADVIIHEPHAVALADLDNDGLRDLVTGERFWGHLPAEPDFTAPARLYGFTRRCPTAGVRWEPFLIDDDSGIGTQLTVGDIDGDGRVDIVISNKKGAFVFLQEP